MNEELVREDIRAILTHLDNQGKTDEELRQIVIDKFSKVTREYEIRDQERIMKLEPSLSHILTLDDLVDIVNEVLYLENGIRKITIHDLDSFIVKALEESNEKDIHEIIVAIRPYATRVDKEELH